MLSERYKFSETPLLKLNSLQLKTRDKLNQKVKDNQYKFENVPCLVCRNKKDFEIVAEKDRYGLHNHVVVCKNCGLVQTNPRFTQETFNQFYNDEYRPLYEGEETATDVFFRQQYFRGGIIYSLVNRFKEFNQVKNPFVLEVGCAAGGILKVFKEHGCIVKGIDLGEEYMKYGKEKHQLDLKVGTLESIKLDRKPDLIIYSNVMEHLTNPIKELDRIKSILNPEGLLFIEVPGIKNIHINYRCDFLMYLQNAHTYHFSLTALKNVFSKAGFVSLFGDEYVRAVAKVAGNSSGKIENDYSSVMNYLVETEKKRELYPYTIRGIKEVMMKTGLGIADVIGVRSFLRRLRKSFSK